LTVFKSQLLRVKEYRSRSVVVLTPSELDSDHAECDSSAIS